MKYSNVDSAYIRKRISETNWEDRRVIDDLIRLREGILNPPTTASSARSWCPLRDRLHDEWLILLRECGEKYYQKEMERQRKQAIREATEREEWKAKQLEEERRQREELADWLRAGGKGPGNASSLG